MRRVLAPALAAAIALGTVAAGQSQQQPADHEVELAIGEQASVDGGAPQGVNAAYDHASGTPCSKDPQSYCEHVLIKLSNPYEEENARKGRERANAVITLTTASNYLSDYDLMVYESDADGTKGSMIASSTAFPIDNSGESTEQVNLVVTTTEETTEVWVLAELVYFSAFEAYHLDIEFTQ